MSDIRKAEGNLVAKLINLIVMERHNQTDSSVRIFHRINRFSVIDVGAALFLSLLPLCFLHLNVSTVTKHDGTEIRGRVRHQNLSAKAS